MSSSDTDGHRTVLLHEAVDALAIRPDGTYVDATLGGAGHTTYIAQQLNAQGTCIGFDLDADAIERARTALADATCTVHLVQANFRTIHEELQKLGIAHVDGVLFDLGWSSFQLDAGRGFSFLKDEPLAMTYAKTKDHSDETLTARTIINEWGEDSLTDIISGWGEERYAARIARAIVLRRTERPFESARDLADTIKAAVPTVYRFGRIHPATRTFQALRIAVNDEMGALTDGLSGALQSLAPKGRVSVITFHSIEDRIVKQRFVAWEKEGIGTRITRKPMLPSSDEITTNPRARSAKLRIFEKYVA
jgi:16S rRNA (cytosine1402-N4)-methyltransferase